MTEYCQYQPPTAPGRLVIGRTHRGTRSPPLRASRAVTVAGQRALLAGSYDRQDSLFLFEVQIGVMDERQPVYETGKPLPLSPYEYIGRGSRLYLLDSSHLYALNLADLG